MGEAIRVASARELAPRPSLAFTVARGRIVEIDILADRERLGPLLGSILDGQAPLPGGPGRRGARSCRFHSEVRCKLHDSC